MLEDFDAHKTIDEARERHERALEHGVARPPYVRFIPVAAALLAVVAAIATLLANQRATAALNDKNDAILQRAAASDAYAFYESRSLKQHVYEAALVTNPGLPAALRARLAAVAAHESGAKAPLLATARGLEERSARDNERSERDERSHETLEFAVTLFEAAIAVVSISALTSSPLLLGLGAIAALAGLTVLARGIAA